jgi:hypothetical protein
LAVALVTAWLGLASGRAGAAPALTIKTPLGQPLKAKEREEILALAHAHLKVPPAKKDQVRLISARRALGDKPGGGKQDLVKSIVFNYATGKALRLEIEVPTGKVVRQEVLPGQPQPSQEEIAEAKAIAQKDAKVAALLKKGAVFEGGLLSEPPKGALPAGAVHRVVELHLLSRDRSKFERILYVDLRTRKIVFSKAEL